MVYKISAAVFILFCFSFETLNAQGCSDPGICTSGALNSANTQDSTSKINFTEASMEALLNANVASEKHKIGLDLVYGIGVRETNIYNYVLRYSARVRERLLVNVKMPFTYVQGNLGTTSGTGDLTLTMQNTFKSGNNISLAYTLGAIIPTNVGNLKDEGNAMPMVYQTSLGLFSALGGLSVRYKLWSAVIGYQHSFGSNSNEFIRKKISVDSSSAQFENQFDRKHYESSRHLSRGADLILRLERGFQFNKLSLVLGVLPILRLSNSKIVEESGEVVEVMGSDGLTLNITSGASYQLNKSTFIRLNMGGPVITREKAPDGLFRDSVFILGVGMKIW